MTQFALAKAPIDFGATRVLPDVTITVTRGDKWGIIGRNGSGSSPGERNPAEGSVARGAVPFLDQLLNAAEAFGPEIEMVPDRWRTGEPE